MATTITDADVETWISIQPPPRKDNMTPEDVAAAQALTGQRKEFLKALKERTSQSEKALEKQLKKLVNKKKPKVKQTKAQAPKKGAAEETAPKEEGVLRSLDGVLPQPKDNTGRGGFFVNSKEVLDAHLKATGGVWRTRFPPEPNGYLHIGHAKAMLVNFGQAKIHGGQCLLRFDDTNPKAEKQEYIDAIIENVKWLGHEPTEINYSSDYFDELLRLAFELIKRGKAYVCHQSKDETQQSRELLKGYHADKFKNPGKEVPFPPGAASPFRDRTPELNKQLFQEMVDGKWTQGTASLRMKMDLDNPNSNMWDHTAYRILDESHPRTGEKYCVYPTYDYTHCLVDSLENITHSLCTLEFADRQAPNGSYHWLVDALGLYHSCTWESARCSISKNVMSKRKLKEMVEKGLVSGWDDPRLLTLQGLRRRGYTPSAVNEFCERIGMARSSNTVCVAVEQLESCIREELDRDAPRAMAVLEPLKLVVTNFDALPEAAKTCTLPNHPNRDDMGTREIPLTKTIYVEQAKFSSEPPKGYKGLTPDNLVRIWGGLFVKCVDVVKENDKVVQVNVTVVTETSEKPSGTLTWVPETAVPVTLNRYSYLFKDCMLDGVERDADSVAAKRNVHFLDLFNEASHVVRNGLVEPGLAPKLAAVGNSWQFMATGYYAVDIESSSEKPVLNEIVSLKESKSKNK